MAAPRLDSRIGQLWMRGPKPEPRIRKQRGVKDYNKRRHEVPRRTDCSNLFYLNHSNKQNKQKFIAFCFRSGMFHLDTLFLDKIIICLTNVLTNFCIFSAGFEFTLLLGSDQLFSFLLPLCNFS